MKHQLAEFTKSLNEGLWTFNLMNFDISYQLLATSENTSNKLQAMSCELQEIQERAPSYTIRSTI
jgi:hypothetical protein